MSPANDRLLRALATPAPIKVTSLLDALAPMGLDHDQACEAHAYFAALLTITIEHFGCVSVDAWNRAVDATTDHIATTYDIPSFVVTEE